jgi:hypothetical protein
MGIFATTTSPTHAHPIPTSTSLPTAMKPITLTEFNIYLLCYSIPISIAPIAGDIFKIR